LNIIDDEHVHDDSKLLPKLVEDIIKSKKVRIDNILADGVYDSNAAVFKCLAADNGILPCIKVRKNAKVDKKTNNIFRNLCICLRNTIYKDGGNTAS